MLIVAYPYQDKITSFQFKYWLGCGPSIVSTGTDGTVSYGTDGKVQTAN